MTAMDVVLAPDDATGVLDSVGGSVVGSSVGAGLSDVGVAVSVGVAEGVRLDVGRGENVRVGDGVRDGVGDGVRDGVGLGVSECGGDDVWQSGGIAGGVQVGDGDSVWLGAGLVCAYAAAPGAQASAAASSSPPAMAVTRRTKSPAPGRTPTVNRRAPVNRTAPPRVLDGMIEAMAGTSVGRNVADERTGADDALVELYRAHYRSLVRLAALLLDDVGASEEVVQDAYIRMHGAWRRIKDPDKALPYLRTTVVNLSRSRMRHRQVAEKHAPKPMPDAASAEYGAIARAERDAVIGALRALPDKQREALVLRFYGDLSESEIAAAMRCSQGTVKSHLHRGKAALARHLEPQP
jgi:RNA polymerase sigma-70 factor (sigma-E family)